MAKALLPPVIPVVEVHYEWAESWWKESLGYSENAATAFFFSHGWKNIHRVAFPQPLTDFHIDSLCNWAKGGYGFHLLHKHLVTLIISHFNKDNCTDVFTETHRCFSLSLSISLTHTFMPTFGGCFRSWATVRAVELASWPRCWNLIIQALCLFLGWAFNFVKIK